VLSVFFGKVKIKALLVIAVVCGAGRLNTVEAYYDKNHKKALGDSHHYCLRFKLWFVQRLFPKTWTWRGSRRRLRNIKSGQMPLIGIDIIIFSVIFSFWWVTTYGTHKLALVSLCGIAIFGGIALLIQDRITEVTIKGVGTIKAAAERANTDAETIASLKSRVENQSATVDLVATEASRAKALSEEASEQTKHAEANLNLLVDKIREAERILSDTKTVTEFITTIVSAQNDDREALDKLKAIAGDKSDSFSRRAEAAWLTIYEEHNKPFFSTGIKVPWSEKRDPSKLSMNDLQQVYKLSPSYVKPGLIEYIWSRQDIQKIDRLDFLIKVMKEDKSLAAAEYAGRYFTQGTNQQIKPLAIEFLDTWWSEHRKDFVTK